MWKQDIEPSARARAGSLTLPPDRVFLGGGGRDPTPGTSLFSDPPRAELFRMLTPFPPSPFLPRERVCHPPIPPYPWIEFIFGRWIPSSHHNHGETTSTPFFQLYKKQYPISLQSLALQDSSLRHLLSSLGKVWGTGGKDSAIFLALVPKKRRVRAETCTHISLAKLTLFDSFPWAGPWRKKNNGTQFMTGGERTFFEEVILKKKDIDIGFFSAKNKVKAIF